MAAGRPTVLIVDDDDDDTRQLFRTILESEGFRASRRRTLQLPSATWAKVDVALCDVRLGDEDGLGFGAYGYLVKPVRRSELLLNVRNGCAGASSRCSIATWSRAREPGARSDGRAPAGVELDERYASSLPPLLGHRR